MSIEMKIAAAADDAAAAGDAAAGDFVTAVGIALRTIANLEEETDAYDLYFQRRLLDLLWELRMVSVDTCGRIWSWRVECEATL